MKKAEIWAVGKLLLEILQARGAHLTLASALVGIDDHFHSLNKDHYDEFIRSIKLLLKLTKKDFMHHSSIFRMLKHMISKIPDKRPCRADLL